MRASVWASGPVDGPVPGRGVFGGGRRCVCGWLRVSLRVAGVVGCVVFVAVVGARVLVAAATMAVVRVRGGGYSDKFGLVGGCGMGCGSSDHPAV